MSEHGAATGVYLVASRYVFTVLAAGAAGYALGRRQAGGENSPPDITPVPPAEPRVTVAHCMPSRELIGPDELEPAINAVTHEAWRCKILFEIAEGRGDLVAMHMHRDQLRSLGYRP